MFSSINKSSVSSKISTFARSKAAVAAAVAVTSLGFARSSFGVISNITSVATQSTVGLTTSVTNVAGAGATYSIFQPSSTYTVSYGGDTDRVLSVTAGGNTYAATGLATNVVRRFVGSNNDQLWYDGTGTGVSGSTVSLQGPALSGFNQAFDSNNLNVGADNLFSNQGNAVGDNTNVDRLDLLFTNGIKASPLSAFGIMDRGPTDDHDAFKIAAITALDSSGNPSNYGPLLSFADGSWGTTDIVSAQQEIILRKNDSVAGDTLHPSDSTAQPIGGVLIPTSDLAAAGSTIYGYSLFSADVTGSGTGLVNWTNSGVYHSADSTSTGGGIDPVATAAILYTTTAVPEPTTGALLTLAAGGALLRRRSARKATTA